MFQNSLKFFGLFNFCLNFKLRMGGIIFEKMENGKLIKYLAKKLGTVFCEGPNERILSHDCPEIIKIFVPYFFKYSIPLKK